MSSSYSCFKQNISHADFFFFFKKEKKNKNNQTIVQSYGSLSLTQYILTVVPFLHQWLYDTEVFSYEVLNLKYDLTKAIFSLSNAKSYFIKKIYSPMKTSRDSPSRDTYSINGPLHYSNTTQSTL